MNIDDKINASNIALRAFKGAEKVIDSLGYKTDGEEAKAFKCLVLSRLASICLDCSDEILGVSTAGKDKELSNFLIDYPIGYGDEVLLLTGTARYCYVGTEGKKHYRSFDVVRWKWENKFLEDSMQGPTDVDISCLAGNAVEQLNANQ